MKPDRPDISLLRELFSYEDGILRWRVHRGRVTAGTVAGTTGSYGHRSVVFEGRRHMVSHIVYALVHNEWPEEWVDHKDRDPTNDKAENLRKATPQQNAFNRRVYKNSHSGVRGVTLDKKTGLYRARICRDGVRRCIGSFGTPEEASQAYQAAAAELFGEFTPCV